MRNANRVQGPGQAVQITPEMQAAGLQALLAWEESSRQHPAAVLEIFQAMLLAADKDAKFVVQPFQPYRERSNDIRGCS